MTAQKSSFKKAIIMVVFLFIIGGALAYSGIFSNVVNAASPIILTATSNTAECKIDSSGVKCGCKIDQGATTCGSINLVASVPAFTFSSTIKTVYGYFKVSTDSKNWTRVVGNPGYTLTKSAASTQKADNILIKTAGTYQYVSCLYANSSLTAKAITDTCSKSIKVTVTAAPLSVDATVTPIQAYCDSLGKCEPVNIKVTGTDMTYGINNIILYSIANDGVAKTKEAEQSCSSKKECSLEKSVSRERGGHKYVAEVFNTHKTTSSPLGDKATKDIMVQIGKDDPPTAVGNVVIVPNKGEIAANDKISITLKAKDDVGLTIGKITFSKMGHETEFKELPGFDSINVSNQKEWIFSWSHEFSGWKVDKDKDTSGVYNIKITFKDTNPNNIEGYSVATGAITIADELVAKLRKLGISNDDIGLKSGPSGSILGYMAMYGITSEEMLPVAEKLLNMMQHNESDAVVDPLAQIKGLLIIYRGAKNNLFPANNFSSISVDPIISALKNVEIKVGTNSKTVEKFAKAVPGGAICLLGGLTTIFSGGTFGVVGGAAGNIAKDFIKKGSDYAGNALAKMAKSALSTKINLNNPRSESDIIKIIAVNGNYALDKAEYASSYYLFRSMGVIDAGGNIIKGLITSPKAGVIMLNGYNLESNQFYPYEKAWFLRLAVAQGVVLPTVTSQKPIGGSSKTADLSSQYQPLIDFYEKQAQSGLYMFASNQISVNKPIDLDAFEANLAQQCQ